MLEELPKIRDVDGWATMIMIFSRKFRIEHTGL